MKVFLSSLAVVSGILLAAYVWPTEPEPESDVFVMEVVSPEGTAYYLFER